jgi:hypothetical protein
LFSRADSALLARRASMQMTGSPRAFSARCSQIASCPLACTIRATSSPLSAAAAKNLAIASGSVATLPRRATFPSSSMMQIAVSFSETSSPA